MPSTNPTPPPPSSSPPSSPSSRAHEEIQSDVPRLRATHTTLGYRDGITFAKSSSSSTSFPATTTTTFANSSSSPATAPATVAQQGFDVGFPVGAELGLRVGWILGALEGLKGLMADGGDGEGELRRAREELGVETLVGGGEDGMEEEGEGDGEGQWDYGWVDGLAVMRKWMGVVEERGGRVGVDLRYGRGVGRGVGA